MFLRALLASFAGTLIGASAMLATPLSSGQTITSISSISVPAGSTYLGSSVTPFSFSKTAKVNGKTVTTPVTGDIVAAVYKESGGTTDFYYQVDNTSSNPTIKGAPSASITQLSISDFTGFTTNVNTTKSPFPATATTPTFSSGTANPSSAMRASVGDALYFSFSSIAAGRDSAVLLVETDASGYDTLGSFTITGASSSVSSSFEPAVTPEPGFYGSLALAVSAVILVVRRRSGSGTATA